MRASNRIQIYKLAIIVLVCALFVGCRGSGRYVTKHKTEGYKGEAKMNPCLVAERFLDEVSYEEVSLRKGFVKYDSSLGMVVAPASNLQSNIVTDKMLRWVSRGGVYVCLIQRGEKHWRDVGQSCDQEPEYWDDPMENDSLDYLLGKMGVDLVDDASLLSSSFTSYYNKPHNPVVLGSELPHADKVKVTNNASGEIYELLLGGTTVMNLDRAVRYNEYSDKGPDHRFLGLSYGSGKIVFVTDARFLRNPYLGMEDHAKLLEQLAYEANGDIIFSFSKRRGFWSLLASYAWPALIGVFVLLVLWLWKSMPRFGPLLEIPEGHARDYAQTVRNTGHFLWKQKRLGSLLDPLRDQIYQRSGLFNPDGEAKERLIETLSESSGVSPEEVLEALSSIHSDDSTTVVRITKNLQTILKSL